MGFIDWVKGLFDKGGIKVKLAVPKDFTWGDETIPVSVTLTGHKTEPRTVMALGFIVEDERENNASEKTHSSDSEYGQRVRIEWEREGVINLAPGQTTTLEVPVMISSQEEEEAWKAVDDQLQESKIGRMASKAGTFAKKFGMLDDPAKIRRYRITVHALAEGANHAATHSQDIRQGGAFKFGMTTNLS